MPTQCRITLPDSVRVDDVATLIGIYDGLSKQRCPLGRNSWRCRVNHVSVESISGIPNCARIIWPRGEVIYHFEWDEPGRGLLPNSTPFWIAVGQRLVEFFGGSVIYRDDGDQTVDFFQPWRKDCYVVDEPDWTVFQERVMKERPLEFGDILRARRFAAYDDLANVRRREPLIQQTRIYSLN